MRIIPLKKLNLKINKIIFFFIIILDFFNTLKILRMQKNIIINFIIKRYLKYI